MPKPEKIMVAEVNPPTQIEAERKIKELCEFLSGVWNAAIKIKK